MKTFIKKFRVKIFALIAIFIFSLGYSHAQYRTQDLKCGSSKTETSNSAVPEHFVPNLTSADTSAAIAAYLIWVAALDNNIECVDPERCGGEGTCEEMAVGVGGKEGNYPTPTYNKITKRWEFPESKRAVIKCGCVGKSAIAYVEFTDGVLDIDPFTSDDDSASIALNDNLGNINIYPNPASDRLNIAIDQEAFEGELKVNIYDQMGRVIETRNMNLDNDEDFMELVTVNYSEGMYYVIIQDEKAIISSAKFYIVEE